MQNSSSTPIYLIECNDRWHQIRERSKSINGIKNYNDDDGTMIFSIRSNLIYHLCSIFVSMALMYSVCAIIYIHFYYSFLHYFSSKIVIVIQSFFRIECAHTYKHNSFYVGYAYSFAFRFIYLFCLYATLIFISIYLLFHTIYRNTAARAIPIF